MGGKGYISPYFPKIKSPPKDKWNVNRYTKNMQSDGDDTGTDTENTVDTSNVEFNSRRGEG